MLLSFFDITLLIIIITMFSPILILTATITIPYFTSVISSSISNNFSISTSISTVTLCYYYHCPRDSYSSFSYYPDSYD